MTQLPTGPFGFLPTDPLNTNKPYGYRSHKVGEKVSGGLLGLACNVSYNGFTFPPAIKSRATLVPEPNKAKTNTKWYTIVIQIECIITPYDIENNQDTTIDRHMDAIKHRLGQRGQALSFNVQGWGDFKIQQNGSMDVNNGPIPQVLEWEPWGMSRCARIEWLVTTTIPACGALLNTSFGNAGMTDFWYEMEWNVAEGGFWSRTINGGIEVPAIRKPTVQPFADSTIDLATIKSNYDKHLIEVNKIFPRMDAWARDEKFKLSMDRRTLLFTFVDTENPSSTPIPRGMLRCDFEETLSANKPFVVWQWGLSGDITVPSPRKQGGSMTQSRKLAFFAFGVILRDRLYRAKKATTVVIPKDTGTISKDEKVLKQAEITWIPKTINIGNQIFGAKISVDITYELHCTAKEIWQVTGFFEEPVGLTWAAWRNYLGRQGTLVTTRNIIPNSEVIVDLCHPLVGPVTEERATYVTEKADTNLLVPQAPSEANSWTHYRCKFKYETQYFTSAGVLLSEQAKEYGDDDADRANVLKANEDVGLSITPGWDKGNPKSYKTVEPSTGAEPVTVVTMYGSATRIGYAINAPELMSVGGAPAKKYGRDIVTPSSQMSGFIGKDGQPVRMHYLTWRRQYILTGQPKNWRTKSTGHPEIYNAGS